MGFRFGEIVVTIDVLECGYLCSKRGFKGEMYYSYMKMKVELAAKSGKDVRFIKSCLETKKSNYYLPVKSKNILAYILLGGWLSEWLRSHLRND